MIENGDDITVISFAVPSDAFVHTDEKAVVVLEASLSDGRPLPSWLAFDAAVGKFVGVAPAGVEKDLAIRVIARDAQGREAISIFRVHITQKDLKTSETTGRSSLSEQLKSAAKSLHKPSRNTVSNLLQKH